MTPYLIEPAFLDTMGDWLVGTAVVWSSSFVIGLMIVRKPLARCLHAQYKDRFGFYYKNWKNEGKKNKLNQAADDLFKKEGNTIVKNLPKAAYTMVGIAAVSGGIRAPQQAILSKKVVDAMPIQDFYLTACYCIAVVIKRIGRVLFDDGDMKRHVGRGLYVVCFLLVTYFFTIGILVQLTTCIGIFIYATNYILKVIA